MSTSPYYHVGGDEVPSTVLSQDRYAAFMNAEMPLVTARGKTVMGWAELAGPGTDPPRRLGRGVLEPGVRHQPGHGHRP